jgi:arylsulfatase A-like enzyme
MSQVRALLSATLSIAWVVMLVMVGLLLPVDFLNHLGNLLLHVRPAELLTVYSAAWVTYLAISGVAGCLLGFLAAGALLLFRRLNSRTVGLVTLWIIGIVVADALVRGFRVYFEGAPVDHLRSLMGRGFAIANVVVIFGLSIWLTLHSAILLRLRGFLMAVGLCGAIGAGLAAANAGFHAVTRHNERAQVTGSIPPLVVLITIDALAANHTSLYGYHRETTPSLDRLASQSVVFENHYSNGNWTTPSTASILNGVRPWIHRAFRLSARPLPNVAQQGLLPAAQHAGYETLAVTTNFWASPAHQRCADWVTRWKHGSSDITNWTLNHFEPLDSVLFFPSIQVLLVITDHFAGFRNTGNLEWNPEGAFRNARAMLSERADSHTPQFLWVHVFPPHDPYATPPPFLRTFEPSAKALRSTDSTPPFAFQASQSDFPGVFPGRYDEAVLYSDYHVGRFLGWLRQQNRFDDALIIVTADHGESFGHGYGTHAGPMLYEDMLRVPLLIKLPGQRVGRRVQLLTEHADLLPTILDLLGEPAPAHIEGRSLRKVLEGGTLDPKPVYSMDFEENSMFLPLTVGTVAMIEGRYKYTKYFGYTEYFGPLKFPFLGKLKDTLVDLLTDPNETKNLIADAPDRAAHMRSAIDAQISAHSLPENLKD